MSKMIGGEIKADDTSDVAVASPKNSTTLSQLRARSSKKKRKKKKKKMLSSNSICVSSQSSMASYQIHAFSSSSNHLIRRPFPSSKHPQRLTIVAMAPQKKVNKIDNGWGKKWYGAGIFYESSEELEFDVFKEVEKRKVLSNVEKAGLLSKAEELGFTLSSIEKLGLFSKAEQFGLLSLLEKIAGVSPAAMASAALPVFVAALAAIVLIPDDSAALVAVQYVLAGSLFVGAVGLFVGSIVLDGLQEAD